MRRNSVIFLRFLLRRRFSNLNSSNFVETLISPSTNASANTIIPKLPLLSNFISNGSSEKFPSLQYRRTLCSSSDGLDNIVLIKSGEEFNSSLGKVKDESLPAIFYFTAVWCGPCRLISPVIEQLSAKYPHVTTYKIDIDQEGLERTLSKLNIRAVVTLRREILFPSLLTVWDVKTHPPTFLFFQNGEKAAELVGADVSSLKTTMEKLYNILAVGEYWFQAFTQSLQLVEGKDSEIGWHLLNSDRHSSTSIPLLA